MNKFEEGFTLIEVLIAMVIIGIAAGTTITIARQDTQSIRQELYIRSTFEIQQQLEMSIQSKDKKIFKKKTNLVSINRSIWHEQKTTRNNLERLTEYCLCHNYFLTESDTNPFSTILGCYYE